MVAGLIGQGGALRPCDVCAQVDDHPRHVFAGRALDPGTGDPVDYPAHTADEVTRLLASIDALSPPPDVDTRSALLLAFTDTTSLDRHMDCCRAAGCPTGDCDRQTAGAEDLRGAALVEHLMAAAPGAPPPEEAPSPGGGPGAGGFMLAVAMLALWWRLALATVGFSSTNLVDAWLNVLRGTTFTAVAGQFVGLHTADPGAAGTTAVSSVTTRPSITWAAPSGTTPRAITLSAGVSWTSWAGTNGEIVTHISVWSASSAGTFYLSMALTASRTVNTGDTLTLTSASLSLAPIAA